MAPAPFVVKKSLKPLTAVQPFAFKTDSRALGNICTCSLLCPLPRVTGHELYFGSTAPQIARLTPRAF